MILCPHETDEWHSLAKSACDQTVEIPLPENTGELLSHQIRMIERFERHYRRLEIDPIYKARFTQKHSWQ